MKIMHELLITLLANFFLLRRFLHMNNVENEPFNVVAAKLSSKEKGNIRNVHNKVVFICWKMLQVVRDAYRSEWKAHRMMKANRM